MLPSIHRDLLLDEKMVGTLSALPVLLLAAGAVWGALLVARLGARRALIVGLSLVALGGGLRGIGPATPVVFGMTVLMGLGVSISQPTLPSLVRRWVPTATGMATGVYANGLLVGEILAASLTTPLVLPLVDHSWEWALAFWSLPVAATVAALTRFTDHDPVETVEVRVRWWPDWRSGLTWRLGLILGCASAAYFGSNAFIPDYLKATHHGSVIPAALTSLNLSQLPSSVVAALFPRRLIGLRWPVLLAGTGILLGTVGFSAGGAWVVGWAGLVGFCTALVLVLTLALPPVLAGAHDVHRLTAAIFTITYACPFIASLLGGAIWDGTGVPITGFLPVGVAGALMICLLYGLDLSPGRAPHPPT